MPTAAGVCIRYVEPAPPEEPIAPPCISAVEVERGWEDGEKVELEIEIVHPELQPSQPAGWIRIAGYNRRWEITAIEGEVACNKDEAPLAWATVEFLNGDFEALNSYTHPLPSSYLDLLFTLAGWHRCFLPIVIGDSR
jgi:hypothetical protein